MLLQAVLSENEALKSELAEMKLQLEQMEKLVFGSKSERFAVFSTYTCGYEALTGAFFINL